MIKKLVFSLCILFMTQARANIPLMDKAEGPLDIQLSEPCYKNGVLMTEKGGIVRGSDLFIQAEHIQYTRSLESEHPVHKIEASGNLFMTYKGRSYKGEKAEFDFTTGKAKITNGCTQSGFWFVGGKSMELSPDGKGMIFDAYVTTSENERNDWKAQAKDVLIDQKSKLCAHNITFFFVKVPIFWLPVYYEDMLRIENVPFRYRVRWGGNQGLRMGLSYTIRPDESNWTHQALADYSFKYGVGTGLHSKYESETAGKFDSLNYVAQSYGKTWEVDSLRYRLQGYFQNHYESPDLHFVAMYDKLSDRGMKSDFADHPVMDARAGLTQATLSKRTPDWIGRVNGRVRINDFQTVKQELPLFVFSNRPQPLGQTRLILDNKFSTGYLSYVYAHEAPHVHNFQSSRNELSQHVYGTFLLQPFTITPSLGYRMVQYSRSPQNESRFQAAIDGGISLKTRFTRSTSISSELSEPYVDFTFQSTPLVSPGNTYIFDIQDGFSRINQLRYGLRHSWWFMPDSDGFQSKLFADLYARSFFATDHIGDQAYKIWLDSTWDATSKTAFKIESAWDLHRSIVDHFNIIMRRTISKRVALGLEYRERSAYAWRKLDLENFTVDSVRSPKHLRHSEMSDQRQTIIAAIYWYVNPTLDIDFKTRYGIRTVRPKSYYDYEVNVSWLVRGALRLKFTYETRPGKEHLWYVSFTLGQKKESKDMNFRKIGQGNYDLW